MKNFIKVVILIGILVAIFGAPKVKDMLNLGVDRGVDLIETGTDKIKSSGVFDEYGTKAKQAIADGAGGLINKALGK